MNKYGRMSASQLVEKTHSETPFECSYIDSDWSNNVIELDDILKYYTKNKL